MDEPREPRRAIAPDEWAKFTDEFSARNKYRRARFDIFFASGETVEEAEEGSLESISFSKNGGNASIVVVRAGGGEGGEMMTDTLEHVRGVVVQYETDRSENALEITDAKNTLFSLRLESKLDGNS